MINTVEMKLGGRTLCIESGRVATQADGAVIVKYEGTVILASVVASKEPIPDRDFLPLTVEFREKYYAAGKIPGGFFKREGRPRDGEILAARMIDRSLRPLFADNYRNEVQIIVMVLSSDQENNADVPGIIGASAALAISPIPFGHIVGAVRIGTLDERLIVNPSFSQTDEGEMDIVVSATSDAVVQMEGSTKEITDQQIVEAISLAQEQIQEICQLQEQLKQLCGKPKLEMPELSEDPELERSVREQFATKIDQANRIAEKTERNSALDQIVQEAVAAFSEKYPESEGLIKAEIAKIQKEQMRRMICEENRRIDGRGLEDIRPISCEVGILPRTHGSALFTRGQTQSLATITLGTKLDEQKIETLEGESWKSYMLHYNFPPFSVGETRPIRGVSRREIGHGNLAERALEPVIPSDEVFPYTIRIVSDILESNSSSSMATVCAGSLALMDAGVSVKTSVTGVGMGLIKEGDRAVILTDIAGIEDHYGDLDLKVAGTRKGITAVQLDTKIRDLSLEVIAEALQKAGQARFKILDLMDQTISQPRPELSAYAPRIISFKIKPSQIGAVIGTGGKVIREITETTGATINIEDDGTVTIASVDMAAGEEAVKIVKEITAEPELNKLYTGEVKRITPFGAFVEVLRGKEGLLHISEVDFRRIDKVEDVLKVGEEVLVKVIGIDDSGKIKLSRKAALKPQQRAERKQRPKGRRSF